MKTVTTRTVTEICTNTEWLRENTRLNLEAIRDGAENDAADMIADELFRRLDLAGYETERAQGQRASYHGWNGANLFAHKLGPVGTFSPITAEQAAEIEAIVAAAVEAAEKAFAK